MALILAILNDRETGTQIVDTIVGANNDVATAESFSAAINILESAHVDLIICDLGLVDTDYRFASAFDFLDWAKKNERLAKIPFLCFTLKTMINSSFADGVRTAAKALGASNYCAMAQFDDGSLTSEIKRLLGGHDKGSSSRAA